MEWLFVKQTLFLADEIWTSYDKMQTQLNVILKNFEIFINEIEKSVLNTKCRFVMAAMLVQLLVSKLITYDCWRNVKHI